MQMQLSLSRAVHVCDSRNDHTQELSSHHEPSRIQPRGVWELGRTRQERPASEGTCLDPRRALSLGNSLLLLLWRTSGPLWLGNSETWPSSLSTSHPHLSVVSSHWLSLDSFSNPSFPCRYCFHLWASTNLQVLNIFNLCRTITSLPSQTLHFHRKRSVLSLYFPVPVPGTFWVLMHIY